MEVATLRVLSVFVETEDMFEEQDIECVMSVAPVPIVFRSLLLSVCLSSAGRYPVDSSRGFGKVLSGLDEVDDRIGIAVSNSSLLALVIDSMADSSLGDSSLPSCCTSSDELHWDNLFSLLPAVICW